MRNPFLAVLAVAMAGAVFAPAVASAQAVKGDCQVKVPPGGRRSTPPKVIMLAGWPAGARRTLAC